MGRSDSYYRRNALRFAGAFLAAAFLAGAFFAALLAGAFFAKAFFAAFLTTGLTNFLR